MVDPLQLMKEASKSSGLSKEDHFAPGEIIWVFEVKKRNSKKVRFIETNDFSRTNHDFKASNEEIKGTLGIYFESAGIKTAVYYPIYNGTEIKAPSVKVGMKYIHKCIDSDHVNDMIVDAIKASIEDLLSDFNYKIYFSGLQLQHKLIQSQRHLITCPSIESSLLSLTKPILFEANTKSAVRHDFLVNNAELLQWFSSKDSFLDLSGIMSQKVYSRRHEILTKSKSINLSFMKGEIVLLSNPVFLFEDGWIDSDLYGAAKSNIFDPFNLKSPIKHYLRSQDFFVRSYIEYVLIPEGIVSFLCQKFSISREKAENQYLVPVIDREDLIGFDRELEETFFSPKSSTKKSKETKKHLSEKQETFVDLPDLDTSSQSSDFLSNSLEKSPPKIRKRSKTSEKSGKQKNNTKALAL